MLKKLSLLLQLEKFGLDPAEWTIEPSREAADIWLLQNRHDREFQFIGQTTESPHRWQWQNIFLISI